MPYIGRAASRQFVYEAKLKGRELYNFKETGKAYRVQMCGRIDLRLILI